MILGISYDDVDSAWLYIDHAARFPTSRYWHGRKRHSGLKSSATGSLKGALGREDRAKHKAYVGINTTILGHAMGLM